MLEQTGSRVQRQPAVEQMRHGRGLGCSSILLVELNAI